MPYVHLKRLEKHSTKSNTHFLKKKQKLNKHDMGYCFNIIKTSSQISIHQHST